MVMIRFIKPGLFVITCFQQRKQKKSGFGLFGLFKKKGNQAAKPGKERPKSSYIGQDWSPSSRSPSTSPTSRSPAMMPRSQSQPFIDKPKKQDFFDPRYPILIQRK